MTLISFSDFDHLQLEEVPVFSECLFRVRSY